MTDTAQAWPTGANVRHCKGRAFPWLLAWLGCAHGGCLVPGVPEDVYVDAGSYDRVADAARLDAGVDEQPTFDASWPDVTDDASSEGGGGPPPPNPACDFSGHWMVTERMVSTGLGIQQAALWWMYYEIEQSGDALRVREGLACGSVGNRESALGVAVDTSASWQATWEKNDLRGIAGAVREDGDECELQLGRVYRVLGATLPHYADTSRSLPGVDQPASGDSPGWEDWDGDGQPGISAHLSGALSGSRYMATRLWTSYAGRVSSNAESFRIPMDWSQTEALLGASSDVLKATGTKDADRSLHFAQFDALAPDALPESDAELCAMLRERAPELGPDGV